MPFEVVLAESLGFCFGVRDALALVRARAREKGEPVTVLGPIVHNPAVVAALEAEGIRFASGLEDVRPGSELVLTPHGVADPVRREAASRVGADRLADATCPLVHRVHVAARSLHEQGRHVVVVGRRDHVEVKGLVGSFPQGALTVVLEEDELATLEGKRRIGVVAQTTQPVERVRALVGALRSRLPSADVVFVDTVCYPTKLRQEAAQNLAKTCDAVVIVGGKTSNNTRELAETVRAFGARPFWVEDARELEPGWFSGARRVGVTAGTSTPDDSVAAVVRALEAMAA
ncbi:MAG TPA: 4-hydroxy-3-methylbut-2-enyl diphosphate reductase [Planctomycetota bacterium]|nr:4-hydroxy-3-methylbut-2-enyl diphosphate reductase [Planctomycetota bacterium]